MPRLVDTSQEDFSRGMDDSRAANRYPRNAAREIINGRVERDGTVSRRDGSRRRFSVALNNGQQCFFAGYFSPAAGNPQQIAIFGDTAYYSDDGWATQTQIATGLATGYYDYAIMRVGSSNYLLLANGDTTIKTWDGSTWSTASGAPSGATRIEVFNERVWATGHSGILLVGSALNDFNNWSSPDAVTVQMLAFGAGTPTALFALGPHLLVFDGESVSYVDGFGEQTLIVQQGPTGFSRSVGCEAFRTIQAVGDSECAWFSRRGVELYTPGQGIRLMSANNQRFIDSIDRVSIENNPGLPTAVYDQIRQNYHLAVPLKGSQNQRVAVFNLYHRQQGSLAAPSIDRKVYSGGEPELFFSGDNDGYMQIDSGGQTLLADSLGYARLAVGGGGADPIIEDSDGYIDQQADDSMPAALYLGPCSDGQLVVYSGGYDGFIRKHYGADFDKDDELASSVLAGLGKWSLIHMGYGGAPITGQLGTEEQQMMVGSYGESEDASSIDLGGQDVTLTLVPRPFTFGSPEHTKRARQVVIQAVNEAQATFTVKIRGAGESVDCEPIVIGATNFDQPKEERGMAAGEGQALQVEITTTDRTRVALVGLSAEILRERV